MNMCVCVGLTSGLLTGPALLRSPSLPLPPVSSVPLRGRSFWLPLPSAPGRRSPFPPPRCSLGGGGVRRCGGRARPPRLRSWLRRGASSGRGVAGVAPPLCFAPPLRCLRALRAPLPSRRAFPFSPGGFGAPRRCGAPPSAWGALGGSAAPCGAATLRLAPRWLSRWGRRRSAAVGGRRPSVVVLPPVRPSAPACRRRSAFGLRLFSPLFLFRPSPRGAVRLLPAPCVCLDR